MNKNLHQYAKDSRLQNHMTKRFLPRNSVRHPPKIEGGVKTVPGSLDHPGRIALSEGRELTESRGGLLRRLDELEQWLYKAKGNLSNSTYLSVTGELEKLKREAECLFVDCGPPAQGALRETSRMEFQGSPPREPRSKLERQTVLRGGVLPPKRSNPRFTDQAIKNVECMIELVDKVRKRVTTVPSTRTVALPTDLRDLEKLKRSKSLRQVQAAAVFGVSARYIRKMLANGKLTKTEKGRVVSDDDKFVKQFNLTHAPKEK